jgi:hypothetical protein
MKKLILFATYKEAEALLKEVGAAPLTSSLYKSKLPDIFILITGMGMIKSAIALASHSKEFDAIYNLGAAAALQEKLPLFSCHKIASVSCYTPLPEKSTPHTHHFVQELFPPYTLQKEGLRLLSLSFPLNDSSLRHSLSNAFDLVDMEAYALATAFPRLSIVKAISDQGTEEAPHKIAKHLPKISITLKEWAQQELAL